MGHTCLKIFDFVLGILPESITEAKEMMAITKKGVPLKVKTEVMLYS